MYVTDEGDTVGPKLIVTNALNDEKLYKIIADWRDQGKSYKDIVTDLDKMGYRSKHRKPLSENTVKFIAQKGPTSRSVKANSAGRLKAALKAILAIDMPADKKLKAVTQLVENDDAEA